MNSLFFEHPNKRERVNLAFYFSIELISTKHNKKEMWSILFHRDLVYEGRPISWTFDSEEEASKVFTDIAAVMKDFLFVGVLKDVIICKDFVEWINVSPSEDGWGLFIHVRKGDDHDVFDFPATSEQEAMDMYRDFIK